MNKPKKIDRSSWNRRDSWHGMLRHYDDLLGSSGWNHLRPFRDVVAKVLMTSWADRVLATASHENLNVELPGSWPTRDINVTPGFGVVRITSAEGVHEVFTETVPVESAFELMERQFKWLVGDAN